MVPLTGMFLLFSSVYCFNLYRRDDNDNVFSDIYNLCHDELGCSGYKAAIECYTGANCSDSDQCNITSPEYDSYWCVLSSHIWDCILNESCFIPFNATILGFAQECENNELFCSSAIFLTNKDDYCMDADDCTNDEYIYLWNTFYDSMSNTSGDCAWEYCGSLINACTSILCRQELYFVTNIEETYKVNVFIALKCKKNISFINSVLKITRILSGKLADWQIFFLTFCQSNGVQTSLF